MTEKKHTETLLLLEKFFNGMSSLQEERRLYTLFMEKELPEDLEPYRETIQWFANSLNEKPAKKAKAPVMKWIKIATGVAAAAVIGVISYSAVCRYHHQKLIEETYAGSFISRNGVKTTDLSIVLPEIERVESLAEETDRKYEMQIAQMEQLFNN